MPCCVGGGEGQGDRLWQDTEGPAADRVLPLVLRCAAGQGSGGVSAHDDDGSSATRLGGQPKRPRRLSVDHAASGDGFPLGGVDEGPPHLLRLISSDPAEHRRQRLGHAARLQRLDQQPRVARLAPGPDPQLTPKHCLARPVALGGHARQEPERTRLACRLDDSFDGLDAERPNELVLQISRALVEAQT